MDYARGLLEKYGWTEGKGLGKNESGICEPLKPSLKFDTTGIGHDHSDQFTFKWWEIAFNNAANRIEVDASGSSGTVIRIDETKDLYLSTQKPWTAKLKSNNSLEYGSFVKTEKLTSGGELIPLKTNDTELSFVAPAPSLTDDELFRICGGRTAHKAARHGHKLVGKLARVIEQDNKFGRVDKETMAVLETNKDDDVCIKKKKKKRKNKFNLENSVEHVESENNETEKTVETEGASDIAKVKRNKKKRKSNNNETEEIVETERALDIIKLKKNKKKRKNNNNEPEKIVEAESALDIVKVKKKKKRKVVELCDTEHEQQSDCLVNSTMDAVMENTGESKKKKRKK